MSIAPAPINTPTTTKTNNTSTGRRSVAAIARAAIVAVLFAASLLAVTAPAASAADHAGPDTIGVDSDGDTEGEACGPADLQGGSTCVNHHCSPVSGVCTTLWYCKHGNGTVSTGVCPGAPSVKPVDSLTDTPDRDDRPAKGKTVGAFRR